MISVWGRRRPRRERLSVVFSVALSVAPSVALSVALPDSSPPLKSEISKQPDRPPRLKSDTSVPKYFEDDLQRIFKAVLEAQAPAPAPAPAPVVSEVPREKLKARSSDIYRGKSHMDSYNFCQQCEYYFAIVGAMGPTWIPFAASFLRNRISFRWQQYKRRQDANTPVPVTWDEFKAFLRQSLGNSQAFVDAY